GWKSSPSTMSRMRITGLKKPKYDAVDARTIGLAAPTQCGRRTRCHAGEINACHAIRLPSKPCAEGGAIMITLPELAADALGTFLASYMQRRSGPGETRLVELVPSIARIALECIGNSDALYHNVEHTMLVTLAGHDILRGRALHAHMPPEDYAHLIIACLTHDIGYVRGIVVQDDENGVLIDAAGHKASCRAEPRMRRCCRTTSTVPSFTSWSASKASRSSMPSASRAVEGSRFPSSMPAAVERIDEEAALLRAVDLIGQLGDPHYIRKANALYHEFEEAGLNRQLGYDSPADIVHKYPQFYWNSVAPYVQSAIRYLNVTANGRQWIANLYSNVFRAERDIALGGPQK